MVSVPRHLQKEHKPLELQETIEVQKSQEPQQVQVEMVKDQSKAIWSEKIEKHHCYGRTGRWSI